MENKKQYNMDCNVARALNIIGDKWTLLIIDNIIRGIHTFKDLKETLNNIPTNLLSNRLKFLENQEIIKAEMYSKHPPRYKYHVTEKGNELKLIIVALGLWGIKNVPECKKTIKSISNKEIEVVIREKDTLNIIRIEDVVMNTGGNK